MFEFNPLFVFIVLFIAALLILKPFRKLLCYFIKNIISVIFFVLLSFLCSVFGFTISINIFSLCAALLLGFPGISLALFLALLI